MSEPQSSTAATNTLTITNLEAPHFDKEIMLRLKAQAETFGEHTEISIDPSRHLLHPPELEKNWLISPPGSPPVGWSQIREDPPNTVHLADDLVKALIELGQPVYQLPRPDGTFADRSHLFESEVDDFSLDGHSSDGQSAPGTSGTTHSSGQDQGQRSQGQGGNGTEYERLPHQLRGLKIDTQAHSNDTPAGTSTCHSPASSLLPPQTPTVQVFSPAKEAEGDQPFITVQDWGIDREVPQPLRRRGTIPKTAFPTGPIHV
ncbi:carbohydrate-binding module 1 protein [Lunasporangiospora selenospora]|uniref:Carbohydrate-binding module 1 protein n=1 Tax=Lunasporangiospora selenospora TaxID=979761 RepID=A0A9P6FXM0_9FUNG|nr:carbohydrate-binding module 1 protein [Lunasporangiospora selenospora]